MILPDKDSEAGFTLVEVLVGLMLTAILVAALGTLGSQFRTFLNANERIERASELNKVARKVAGIIEQAEALPVMRNKDNQDVFLIGRPDSIVFAATLKTGVQISRFRDVEIAGADGEYLAMEIGYHRLVPANDAKVKIDKIELMSGNSEIRFRYLDSAAPSGQMLWTDNWTIPARLPRAVLVVLLENLSNGQSINASALAGLAIE